MSPSHIDFLRKKNLSGNLPREADDCISRGAPVLTTAAPKSLLSKAIGTVQFIELPLQTKVGDRVFLKDVRVQRACQVTPPLRMLRFTRHNCERERRSLHVEAAGFGTRGQRGEADSDRVAREVKRSEREVGRRQVIDLVWCREVRLKDR